MTYPPDPEKPFTPKQKTLKILEIIGNFSFVLAAVLVHDKIPILAFWLSILLFGSGGMMALRELRKRSTAPDYQNLAQQALDRQNDPGNFSYDAQGFSTIGPQGKVYWQWSDIEVVFAYKLVYIEERFASEETRLEIMAPGRDRLPLSTYTPGWPQFLIRLREKIPGIPPDWVEAMALPAFEPNPRLLFDRQGRSQAELEQQYYPHGFAP